MGWRGEDVTRESCRSGAVVCRPAGMAIAGPKNVRTGCPDGSGRARASLVGWDAWRAFLRLLDGLLDPSRKGTEWSAAPVSATRAGRVFTCGPPVGRII